MKKRFLCLALLLAAVLCGCSRTAKVGGPSEYDVGGPALNLPFTDLENCVKMGLRSFPQTH